LTEPDTVALYVHWPYCARICPYCDFNVVRDRGRTGEQTALSDAIVSDMEAQAVRLGDRQLASIFFGGGTPSLMPPEYVARVIQRAQALFPVGREIEITLEANPTDAEAARFAALARAGVNRLSLGVQSLDDEALRFLGRNHSAAEAMRALELARAAFARLSIDLIYARPGQTVAHWTDELHRAVDLGFEHISPYQLTIEPATAFGRAFARGTLAPPDEDRAADLYESTQSTLEARGFDAYEVSNHARGEAARSVHNLHVWRGGDYVGVGPGAHGRLTLDGVRTATVAQRGVADYLAGVDSGRPWVEQQRLSPVEADEERVLLGLRTVEGVDADLIARMGLATRASDLSAQGLLAARSGRIAATARGRQVLDGVLRALLV
jgi:putative oxygen-independent coproporphyrinogen III oxidase